MNTALAQLIAPVCNRKELQEKGVKYFEGNVQLCQDVCALIDQLKLKLQKKCKLMLAKIDYRDSFRESSNNNASYYDEKDCERLMSLVYDQSSGVGYNKVHKQLVKVLSNGLDCKEQVNKVSALLPSKYKLEQTFPKINEIVIKEGDPNYKDKEAAAWKAANEQLMAENNGKNLMQVT